MSKTPSTPGLSKSVAVPGDRDPDDEIDDAAIYARTSESKPEFSYSIEEQVSRCWNRCDELDWDVKFVFTDEGKTGTNTDREGFSTMLDRAEQGLIDVVVFWKLDRFARSLADLVRTEEKLREWGVAVHSVTEFLDTSSPVGRFNFRNLASAAELESDLTSQRVQMGLRGMAKSHRWPNATPPLGYSLSNDQMLHIIDDEAQLVRDIFQRYLEAKSMPQVADELNAKGETTKGGGEWTRWTVRKVLSNDIYRGQYQLGDYQEYVAEYRIVSDELFEAVNRTRHRFINSRGSMSESRKSTKAEKILSEFKSERGGEK